MVLVVHVDADNDEKSEGGVFGMATAALIFAGDNGGFRIGLAVGGGGGGSTWRGSPQIGRAHV